MNERPEAIEDAEQDDEQQERRPLAGLLIIALIVLLLIGSVVVVIVVRPFGKGEAASPEGAEREEAAQEAASIEEETAEPQAEPAETEESVVVEEKFTCEILPIWSVPGLGQGVPVTVVVSGPDGSPLPPEEYPEDGTWGASPGAVEAEAYSAPDDGEPGDTFLIWYESASTGMRCEWEGRYVSQAFTEQHISYTDKVKDVWDYDLTFVPEHTMQYDDIQTVWLWMNGYPVFPQPGKRLIPAVMVEPSTAGTGGEGDLPLQEDLEPFAGAAPLIQAIENPGLPIPDPQAINPMTDSVWAVPDGAPLPPEWVTGYGSDVQATAGSADTLFVIPEGQTYMSNLHGAQVFWPWEWTFEPFEFHTPTVDIRTQGAWSGVLYDTESGTSYFWIERGNAEVLTGDDPVTVQGPDDGVHVALVVIDADGANVTEPELIAVPVLREQFGLYSNGLAGQVSIMIKMGEALPGPDAGAILGDLVFEILMDTDGDFETGMQRPFAQYEELGIDLHMAFSLDLQRFCGAYGPAFDEDQDTWDTENYVSCGSPFYTVALSPDRQTVVIDMSWADLVAFVRSIGGSFDGEEFTWRVSHADYAQDPDMKDTFPDSPVQIQ